MLWVYSSPLGWRWTKQNFRRWPDSHQSQYCKLNANKPRADTKTGTRMYCTFSSLLPPWAHPVLFDTLWKQCLYQSMYGGLSGLLSQTLNAATVLTLFFFPQLSDAISIIGREDFPQKWPDLLTEMVTRFQSGDFHIINGVLRTAHSLFKRCLPLGS